MPRPFFRYIAVLFALAFCGLVLFSMAVDADTPAALSSEVWHLEDADIRAVIESVSLVTGKSFVVDPRVQGKVTFVSHQALSKEAMYQAFLSMLQVMNYAAVPSGKLIKIVPAMNANQLGGQIATAHSPGKGDRIVVRMISVNHISAMQLVPVLRPLMPSWSNVTAYMPSNTLIIAGAANNMQRLVDLVHEMDHGHTNQISVVNLNYANAEQIVNVLNKLTQESRSAGKVANVAIAADPRSNSVLVSGNLANIAMERALIRKLDQPNTHAGDTEVIALNYLTAKDIAPMLQKIAKSTIKVRIL